MQNLWLLSSSAVHENSLWLHTAAWSAPGPHHNLWKLLCCRPAQRRFACGVQPADLPSTPQRVLKVTRSMRTTRMIGLLNRQPCWYHFLHQSHLPRLSIIPFPTPLAFFRRSVGAFIHGRFSPLSWASGSQIPRMPDPSVWSETPSPPNFSCVPPPRCRIACCCGV